MSVRTAIGTAQAKLIVIGEHFVVPFTDQAGAHHAGSAAIAIPLPRLRTEVRLTASSELKCELHPESEEQGFGSDVSLLMEKALRLAAQRFQWDLVEKPLRLSSRSDFPSSRGLGSSASFSVALARALTELSGKDGDIRSEAQQIENLFHGKSSGLDTSAISAQEPIFYRDGKILKTFERRSVDFVVADSGPRDSSSVLVGRTLELRRNQPEKWHALSGQVNLLADRCLSELQNPAGAGEVAYVIRSAQEILAQIGLVDPQLEHLLKLGHKAGALAGKLSGAGAGGVALFAAHKGQGPELADRMREAGAKVVTVA